MPRLLPVAGTLAVIRTLLPITALLAIIRCLTIARLLAVTGLASIVGLATVPWLLAKVRLPLVAWLRRVGRQRRTLWSRGSLAAARPTTDEQTHQLRPDKAE
jgi:glycerol-3-phosphate acyltransferase PlsY